MTAPDSKQTKRFKRTTATGEIFCPKKGTRKSQLSREFTLPVLSVSFAREKCPNFAHILPLYSKECPALASLSPPFVSIIHVNLEALKPLFSGNFGATFLTHSCPPFCLCHRESVLRLFKKLSAKVHSTTYVCSTNQRISLRSRQQTALREITKPLERACQKSLRRKIYY